MATQAGVGISHHRNVVQAGQEAARKALAAAGVETPDFVFLFSSLGYDQQALVQSVRAATGHCPLSGCSGQGIITQNEADESSFSVAVMVICSDTLRFQNHVSIGLKQDPAAVGSAIASQLKAQIKDDALALFLFTDGLTVNFDRLAAGIEALGISLPFLGGAAGSDVDMQHSYQYCNNQVVSDGVVATLLSGQAQIAWALNHGCIPIGCERKVTRASGNIIYEIDHRPVFEVLKEYLTETEIQTWDKTIVSFCFGLKAPTRLNTDDDFVIRYLPAKDDVAGSVTLQTEVLEGSSIWVTRRDPDRIAQGVERAAQQIKTQIGDRAPELIFQFDCYGRGKSVLGERQKLDLQKHLQQAVGSTLPWIGLYTNGEIAPVGETNSFHNYTIVLCAIA
ncbi:FIST signal transduction protein [Myxacorys almedinensis]|uniref:Histidine kinase n=1 Tax=Myxacorys almedinensis A TaxID=2690445 RepID=A0A8J7Z670_9CYAN|nr:FIST N-terminal domain-containing protein [Myxacorys almedinensis]NDJ18818.1 histidine kinase [Myxacorys almedinensis A]